MPPNGGTMRIRGEAISSRADESIVENAAAPKN
jgi:hypothetical protein